MTTDINEVTREEAPATTPAVREVRVEPVADVFRSETGVRLLVDLPGVSDDGLSVNLHDGVLRIEGRARRGEGLERVYQRAFRVDRRIDVDAVEARIKQGVLTLTLPFRAEAQPRRIQVQAN